MNPTTAIKLANKILKKEDEITRWKTRVSENLGSNWTLDFAKFILTFDYDFINDSDGQTIFYAIIDSIASIYSWYPQKENLQDEDWANHKEELEQKYVSEVS